MSLGATMRKLRLRRGESLQQVADAVNASKAHIWEVETGKSRNPSIDLLTRLAHHFKVSLASLVGEDPAALNRLLQGDPEAVCKDQLMRMYRQLQSLPESERAIVDHMIDGFVERRKTQKDDDQN